MAGDEFEEPRTFDSPTRKITITLTTTNKHLGLKKEDQILGRDMNKKQFMEEGREANQKGKEQSRLHVSAIKE